MFDVRIEPWGPADRPLLDQLLGTPEMTTHLGGPESAEKLAARQARYARPESGQYKVVVDDEPAGYVGYWEREWQGGTVWEVGWAVLPAFQRRGLATAAMRLLLDVIAREPGKRSVHAFPGVENAPSNAVCRKLCFALVGAFDFEYPPGHRIRCNDWRWSADEAVT